MKKFVFYFSLIFLLFFSCSRDENSSTSTSSDTGDVTNVTDTGGGSNENTGTGGNNNSGSGISGNWLIPISEVRDGGPGKDGIPSIDKPNFVSSTDTKASYLNDGDLVVGVLNGNEARAYSHRVLDWHEIINDKINQDFIALNYCPLTGTAFAWDRVIDGELTSFGVSGLLYNSNLILYDRATDSNWAQLRLECVNGERIGDDPVNIKVIETTWGMWKSLYPQTKVLTTETGFERDYKVYPYGNYKIDHDFFLFNASPTNNALPNKERVFAIIDNNKSKVYRFIDFVNGKAIIDSFNGKDFLIVGNEDVITSFELTSKPSNIDFQFDFNNSEHFFKDNEGNKYTIFGEVIEGASAGENLIENISVTSYWFAIAAFYPDPEIY